MKKIIAMITSLVLIISTLCNTAVFAAFSDVDDSNPYKKAITTLSTLKVIDGYTDGTFKPDGAITRAEFTKLIVFMLGFQNFTSDTNDFTDVADDHWAKNYIQTAYGLGIISGMGDGTFAPDAPVTYEQALKMIVCTLGYETFAQAIATPQPVGSWADGYIKQANSLEITKGVQNASYTAGASRGVIAQVLYNSLEVEMYENNGVQWEKTEKTLMKDYLKVKELKGTLVGAADYVTEDCTPYLLDEQMNIKKSDGEEVILNYSEFTQNVTDISKYLGTTLTVYYRQLTEKDEKMLVIIDAESTKNTQIEISYEDIKTFEGNTLKYYVSPTKQENAKLKETDLTVRYNGMLVASDDMVPLVNPNTKEEEYFTRQEALELWLNHDTGYTIYGTVTLTDSANDNIIDMIQIYDYETMVAYTTPTTSDYRITDKLVTGNYLILDPQAADYTYTITKDGKEIPVNSIKANDVILYATSLDKSVYTLIVTTQSIKGTISSINTNSGQLNVADKTYNIGEKFESYINEKDGRELKAGVSGTFYADHFGTLVFGTLDAAAVIPYAYIADAFLDYDEGGKAYVTAFMSNTSSTAVSYPLKDKIKLNGSNVKSEVAVDRLAESAQYANDDADMADAIYGAGKEPENLTYSQPARIIIKDNEITEIVTLESDEVIAQNDDKEQIVRCKELGQYTYSTNSFTQNGKSAFSVNSSTIVISVPSDRTVKKQYAKKALSSIFTTGDAYYVEAYDINSSKVAGLVVVYGNDGSLTRVKKDTNFSVVGTLAEGVYSEIKDDAVLKFDVFAGNTNVAKSWTTYDDSEFEDIKVGDVIQFAYDADNLAQGRINCIAMDDIAAVLDGEETDGQTFNWAVEQEPEEENNFQAYKFDYRFKKAGTDEDEIFYSSTLGAIPYSRACMYNVSQVLLEDKKIYVTKNGFTKGEDGISVIDDSDYEEISITSSTKIIRMEDDREEISRYVADTTTDMSINDLKDAKNYGVDCSKILVCSTKGTAKLIVVYN